MNRRELLARAAGMTVAALSHSTEHQRLSRETPDYATALEQAERRIPDLLAQQVTDLSHKQAGGFILPSYGFAIPGHTASEVTALGALFCNPDSRYYNDSDLSKRISGAIDFLEKHQYADGTIDLPTTNFRSPPDTAFAVEDLTLLYRILARDPSGPRRQWLTQLERFLRRAAGAVAEGGIHTPNHRWVATAALAACYKLFNEPAFLRRADQWLAEGIDCNADGEYTELSNGVYNRAVNRALITAAESLDRPALLEPVRRNLSMMLYCVHPDGELVTDYSRRQDRNTRVRMAVHYLQYRIMSVKDNNGQFANVADMAAAEARSRPAEVSLAGTLPELMLRPELQREKVERQAVPSDYERGLAESGVVRIRRDRLSATIVAVSSRFVSLRIGSAVLEGVRLAAAFFGKGQFISSGLKKTPNGYLLEQHLEGWYNQPLPPEARVTSKWPAMDHSKRGRSHHCRLDTTIALREIARGFELMVTSSGTDNVPLVIEFWLRSGGRLVAERGGELIEADGTNFLTGGFARYSVASDELVIGPGVADHRWAQLRGAEPALQEAVPVTLAGFTPFSHQVRVVTGG